MAKTKVEYDILISCPGDVSEEIKTIENAVKRFNDTYSDILMIRLNTKHWTKDSYNQSGGKAQDLLNKQFIYDCDAAIAIFWTKFGTPTDEYGSGTEEEIEYMISSGKQVFMYFSEKDVPSALLGDAASYEQYNKVQDFKKKYEIESKGIYAKFSNSKDFEEKLFAHLSQHFLTIQKLSEEAYKKEPKLLLKGIDRYSVSEKGICSKYYYDWGISIDELIAETKIIFNRIAGYTVSGISRFDMLPSIATFTMQKKAELPEGIIEYIKEFANILDISLPDNFFHLGDLYQDSPTLQLVGNSGVKLYGTDDEKNKYRDLLSLYDKIEFLLARKTFEEAFDNLKSIQFILSNDGKAVDEDVDILMYFPEGAIIYPEDMPLIDEDIKKTIEKQVRFKYLLGISATSNYIEHTDSIQDIQNASTGNGFSSFFGKNYEEDYYDDLYDIFNYEFFEENGYSIVKLHIDYIKHNTSVAFPTPIFVKQELNSIKYKIRSRNSDSEIDGEIAITNI